MIKPLLPFVKGFSVEYNNGVAVVKFEFISFPSGVKLKNIVVTIPDETLTGFICSNEFIVEWTTTPQNKCLLWYNDTHIAEEYFYRSEFGLTDTKAKLKLPQALLLEQFTPVLSDEPFRSYGKNYPPPGVFTNPELIPEFPGIANTSPVPKKEAQKVEPIAKALVEAFEQDLSAKQKSAPLSYFEFMAPDAGNPYYWGLAQEPYNQLIPENLLPDVCAKTVPNWAQASLLWFISLELGTLIYSPKDQISWQYAVGELLHPCDLSISIVNPNGALTLIYDAETGIEGDTISWGSLNITLTKGRYFPETNVITPVDPSWFIPELIYTTPLGQSYPSNWVSLSSNRGYLPRLTPSRDSAFTQWSGIWEDKTGVKPSWYFTHLLKLKKGLAYDYQANKIISGPEDWLLSLGPEFYPYAPLFADITKLGGDEAYFRLPFGYTRGGKEWKQAEIIAKAFISPERLRFGFHEFVADYSAAEEPVWSETDQEIVNNASAITILATTSNVYA